MKVFGKKYCYSKYIPTCKVKKLIEKVYGVKDRSSLRPSIQYHFERDLFNNETLIIYTNRPGIIIGLKGKNYYELRELYRAYNPKCKDIKIYETNYLRV